MMILKFLFVITFLFENISAHMIIENEGNADVVKYNDGIVQVVKDSDGNATFSLANIFNGNRKKDHCCACNCEPQPEYAQGVEEYYEGIVDLVNNFPAGAPLELADDIMAFFQNFLTSVTTFSKSSSTVLSSSSIAILRVLSKMNNVISLPNTVIEEFDKVLPFVIETYKEIVSNLTEQIGESVVYVVNGAMSDLEYTLKGYMTEFLQSDTIECKRRVNFQPVAERLKFFTTIISLADSLNKCESGIQDVLDALTVLSLISDHLSICVNGVDACSEAIVYEPPEEPLVEPVVECVVQPAVETLHIRINRIINLIRGVSTPDGKIEIIRKTPVLPVRIN